MIISEPIPWSPVPPGAVVLLRDGDVPRLVLINAARLDGAGWTLIEGVEGMTPYCPGDLVRMVALDDHDAVATLAAAGLNPEEIS